MHLHDFNNDLVFVVLITPKIMNGSFLKVLCAHDLNKGRFQYISEIQRYVSYSTYLAAFSEVCALRVFSTVSVL